MTNDYKISIVMATFNGEAYIKKQIDSIVPYLLPGDELIISDDGSTDKTIEIIKEVQMLNSNIRLYEGPRLGVIKNFENALFHSSNDIIMFADQDDVWMENKLSIIRELFQQNQNIELILHDMYVCSNDQIVKEDYGLSDFKIRKRRHGVIYNILYSGYYGCCMSFKKELKDVVLPFSNRVNMYDQWIGLIGEYRGTAFFYDKPLIIHRVHGNNMTKKQSLLKSFQYKYRLASAFINYLRTNKL